MSNNLIYLFDLSIILKKKYNKMIWLNRFNATFAQSIRFEQYTTNI